MNDNIMKKNLKFAEDGTQASKAEKHVGLKLAISMSTLVGCWILWSILDKGWIMVLGLSIVGGLCAEYLGSKFLTNNRWFDRLSVEYSGFSLWRIVIGTAVVLLIFSVFFLAWLLFSKIFH